MAPQEPLVRVGHVVPQRLGKRFVRSTLSLVAATPQHGHAATVCAARRLGHERRLALARLTRYKDHFAALASGHPLDRRTEELQFGGTTHHADRWTVG